ncbi:putative host-nuclease inhibitor protein Gam [Campylobacter hyointestinalis]|uniref:host-nuclease inhibitor Gam family protein n=1 Tax=Campylobacter hyointestinalis TaxID=198 RepID=UPI000728A0C0|nr:host-nuclease inhibitor Gam family protein [Campylobacter hyointestinalis]PPB55453.1 host-nuclease inhibitor protein Gam [Campylobacter hyointestinalis subsp. hyointestinalis]CUU83224.1 putative host-nuclease inhibitor protein Gam [Campylobacter hyointestinalis]
MQINSFSDVDVALKRLCEVNVGIEKINGEVTLECNRIKEARKSEVERLESEKNFIEQQITLFCEDNKAEFAEKRSKEFTFGEIGYRISKSVSIPRVKAKLESLISSIKAFGLAKECITYSEVPNKDALAELKDEDLVKLGLKRVIKDNFRIVPKIESLEAAR